MSVCFGLSLVLSQIQPHSLSSSWLMHRYVCTWDSSSCQVVQPKFIGVCGFETHRDAWFQYQMSLRDSIQKTHYTVWIISFTDTSMFVLQHLQVFHLGKYNPVNVYLLFYIALQGGAEITPIFRATVFAIWIIKAWNRVSHTVLCNSCKKWCKILIWSLNSNFNMPSVLSWYLEIKPLKPKPLSYRICACM